MSSMGIRGKIALILTLMGFVACVAFSAFFLWKGQREVVDRARSDAMTHITRSVEMFMVSTRKFHDDFQRTKDAPDERKRILDDWNRTIAAVDQAVITDHGKDKPRVRLIGDAKIFARPPLAKVGVSIETEFEKEAAERLMKGEKMVEDASGGIYRVAVPLPSQAHIGCAECHLTLVDGEKANLNENVILGSLNAYIPMEGVLAEATSDTAHEIAFMVGAFVCFVFAVLLFINRSVVKPVNLMIGTLTSGSDQVTSAALQISQSSQQLAAGASQQASSLEETSAALTQASATVKQNAENAGQGRQLTDQARKEAETGCEAMVRMSEAIQRIKGSAQARRRKSFGRSTRSRSRPTCWPSTRRSRPRAREKPEKGLPWSRRRCETWRSVAPKPPRTPLLSSRSLSVTRSMA